MSWRAIQNKNSKHKLQFYSELDVIQYEDIEDENIEFYRFMYSLYKKITEELPGKSEKEWANMMIYKLHDLGFEIEPHEDYLNCFILQKNQIFFLSKTKTPLLLFRLKNINKPIVVLSPHSIKEYIFKENVTIIRTV